MQWYALFVKTGEEETIRKLMVTMLPAHDYHLLIPKRKILERRQGKVYEQIKPLLPGYVLLKAALDLDFYYQIKKVPGLYSVLRDEQEPVPIQEHEMALILALTRDSDTIDFSEIYREGDKIKVHKGPLEGLEGIIESYDHRKKRLKVRMSILGQVKRIDLGAELVSSENLSRMKEDAETGASKDGE